MQKIYQQAGGAPGGMPNFQGGFPGAGAPGAGAPGAGPQPGAKGTATGGAEDVE